MPKWRLSQCGGDNKSLDDPGFESQQELFICFFYEGADDLLGSHILLCNG